MTTDDIAIRELDPALPETAATVLPVFRAALAADAPGHPGGDGAFLKYLITPRAGEQNVCVAAFDGPTPVGFGSLVHNLRVNRDLVFSYVWIRPEHRAAAAGPLLDAFRTRARARGAGRLLNGYSDLAAPDYDPVVAAGGGRRVFDQHRMELELGKIDRDRYAAWAAPSEANARYELRSWTTPTPEAVLPALALAGEAMRDSPTGALVLERPPPDLARQRRREAFHASIGMRTHIVAAFTADGAIAGFHDVHVIPGHRMAHVGDTGVPAAFRGRGLGLRLKAELTRRLLAAEPDVEVVGTWNNTGNAPMLRVNDALGYRVGETWGTWQTDL